MEPTVRLFRTLANRPRLCILRLLAVLGECRVKELIDALGAPAGTVSNHLRALSVCGVVWQRRSGGAVYYRLAEEPSNPLTKTVVSLLARVFGRVRERAPKLVARSDQASSREHSDAALFSSFTAFTHPRRLQIIRCLSERGAMTMDAVAEALKMSSAAASRHMTKLARRGIVRRQKDGRPAAFALAEQGASFHWIVLKAVVDSLCRDGE